MDRKVIPLEAVCIKADVPAPSLLGAIMLAVRQVNGQESALLTMIEHPKVVKSTIRFAKTADGASDRKMIHESVGYLPTKQGSNINVNLMGNTPQLSQSDEADDDDKAFVDAFPSISGKLEEWSDDRRKLLEAGK
jgi:hypothetical protein